MNPGYDYDTEKRKSDQFREELITSCAKRCAEAGSGSLCSALVLLLARWRESVSDYDAEAHRLRLMENNLTATPALLPCPFCGAEPNFGVTDDGGEYIQCSKCECSTRLIYPLKTSAKELLIEAWNGRARPAGASDLDRGEQFGAAGLLAELEAVLRREERACADAVTRGDMQTALDGENYRQALRWIIDAERGHSANVQHQRPATEDVQNG